MKVIAPGGAEIEIGTTEANPTVGIIDYSRRVTDDFGVTTVVPRGFARRMSVRVSLPSDAVSEVQRELADLRATAVQWEADDRFDWLNFEGFYKDFELDLAASERSYCTLTVEGVAETEPGADTGEDPAPGGASTLLLIQPVDVAGPVLASSNVPEADYPEWAIGATYPIGARVIKAATHRIYESAASGNLANDPASSPGLWIDTGPTNRFAMFDQALGTSTAQAGSIAVQMDAGAVGAVALLDVVGATVRVQTTGYDETKAVVDGAITFLDLPGVDANVTVTITGSGTVSVGTLLLGALVTLGVTEESPTAGITDFSRKEVDDFGDWTIVQRAWAKRMTARALISTDAIDLVANRIASVRAKPSLWIADDGTDALTIYGFFKDFSIEVDQTVSKLSLTVEGLSLAAQLSSSEGLSIVEKAIYKRSLAAPATPTGGSFDFGTMEATPPAGWSTSIPAGTIPVWASLATASKRGVDGTAPFDSWSAPVQAFANGADGAPGAPGAAGSSAATIYRRSATQPAMPAPSSLKPPSGWYDDLASVPASSNPLWASFGSKATSGANWVWSPAARIEGQDGAPGAPGANGVQYYTWYAFADAPNGSFNFTTGSPGGRIYQGIAVNQTGPVESTNPADYVWSPYVGPPNFGLANFNANTVLAGNKLIKVSGGSAWNASVHSTESFKGGASVSFVVDQGPYSFMAGLNTDPTANASYDTLDFAIYIAGTTVQIYESGGMAHERLNFSALNDVWTVTYNNKTVVYSKNGVPFYTNNAPGANLSLYLDTSILTDNVQCGRILSFAAAGPAGADGAPGAPGAPGSPGAPGAAGRNAITAVQDTTPVGSFIVNDTWYAPTAKIWRRWTGSAWVQFLGNIASLDVITASYISAGTIVASHFLTDQGVDLGAIINGALNTATTAAQGATVNLPITLNSPNPNKAAIVTAPGIPVVSNGDTILVNGSVTVTALTNRGQIVLQYSTDGSTWNTLVEISSASNQGVPVGNYSFSYEYPNPSAGTLYFRMYAEQFAAQSLGDGTAGTNWTLTSGFIRVRRFFSK